MSPQELGESLAVRAAGGNEDVQYVDVREVSIIRVGSGLFSWRGGAALLLWQRTRGPAPNLWVPFAPGWMQLLAVLQLSMQHIWRAAGAGGGDGAPAALPAAAAQPVRVPIGRQHCGAAAGTLPLQIACIAGLRSHRLQPCCSTPCRCSAALVHGVTLLLGLAPSFTCTAGLSRGATRFMPCWTRRRKRWCCATTACAGVGAWGRARGQPRALCAAWACCGWGARAAALMVHAWHSPLQWWQGPGAACYHCNGRPRPASCATPPPAPCCEPQHADEPVAAAAGLHQREECDGRVSTCLDLTAGVLQLPGKRTKCSASGCLGCALSCMAGGPDGNSLAGAWVADGSWWYVAPLWCRIDAYSRAVDSSVPQY